MMQALTYVACFSFILLCVLSYVISSGSSATSSLGIMDGSGIYTFNISHIANQAKHMLTTKKHNVNDNTKTLAIMILYTYGITDKTNLKQLHCNIHLLQQHMKHTPIHIYVWLGKYKYGDNLPYWMQAYDNLFIMEIDNEVWKIGNNHLLRHSSTWVRRMYTTMDYYIMGRWRLLFQPMFIQAMGYKYFLQMDSDAFLTRTIEFNIIDMMVTKSIYFSTTNKLYHSDR